MSDDELRQEDGELTEEQRRVVRELTPAQIDAIDSALLSNVPERWRKVAMVVGKTISSLNAEEYRGIPDVYFSERVRALVSQGIVESVGDLHSMRFSEVRRRSVEESSGTDAPMRALPPEQVALVGAVSAGDLPRVRELLESGVGVAEPDRYGWLPLHRAAANDRDEVIRFLIEQGSPLERRGTDGWTALHLACVSGSSRAVAALVSAGADINSLAQDGNSALHLALIPKVRETVEILIRAGADVTIQDRRGLTPTAMARERGLIDLARLLEVDGQGEG